MKPGGDEDFTPFGDAADEDFSFDQIEEGTTATTGLYEHYRLVVDKGQTPLRIDKFLADKMEYSSRNRISLAAEAGAIFVGDTPVKSSYKVKPGDVITLRLARPPHERGIVAEDIPIDVVYEDDCLMVVNKPAGMVVHPGNGNFTGTLVNALAYYWRDVEGYDPNDPNVGLVHRIDKDTSGLLLVAKKPEAKTYLARQFFEKTTERTYYALVWGRPEPSEGTIEGNIGRDPKERTRMAVFPPGSEEGKAAITHYRIVEPLAFVSLVACRLETGRTHQIRAHFKHINHPLLCDERYGGDKILRGRPTPSYLQFAHNAMQLCPRQALHAATLGFTHPTTHEWMQFSCPIPPDMASMIDAWRNYTHLTLKI